MKLLTLTTLLFSLSLFAQDKSDPKQAEMMQKMQAYSTPGPEHKHLAEYAGNWNYTSKFWMSAEAKPEESKGTAVNKMILGGRYLEQQVKGKTMGQNFEGRGLMGFDNVTKTYQEIWIDNMGTGIMTSTASYDPAAKTMTETGEYTCPVSESGKAKFRAETKMMDKDNYVYTMYGTGMDPKGKEFKMMELTYKRAK